MGHWRGRGSGISLRGRKTHGFYGGYIWWGCFHVLSLLCRDLVHVHVHDHDSISRSWVYDITKFFFRRNIYPRSCDQLFPSLFPPQITPIFQALSPHYNLSISLPRLYPRFPNPRSLRAPRCLPQHPKSTRLHLPHLSPLRSPPLGPLPARGTPNSRPIIRRYTALRDQRTFLHTPTTL